MNSAEAGFEVTNLPLEKQRIWNKKTLRNSTEP